MSAPDLLNLLDYEAAAAARLDPTARDYYASGAHDQLTLRANREAFERIRLRPRVLRGVEQRDASVELLGRRHPWPVLIAPAAFARLAHPEGERAVARAAAAAGVTQVLSTLATCTIEEVAAAAHGPRWFQLYVFRDRDVTLDLVRRAEAAGYEALALTVDAPMLGRREADARNRFSLPPGLTAANLPGERLSRVQARGAESGLFQYFASLIDPSLTWADLEWLCAATRLPVLVKGVVREDDAALAVEHGASGVIVSNHGGRQLDGAVASVDALPGVASALRGRVPVLVDGGVRRGTDVLKAVALGADAVLIGRPVLWGLAVDGEAGVRHVLDLLAAEIDLAMALCGARSLAEVIPDLLA